MTDLAKLVVRLEAETARYQKELEKSRSQLRRFDRQAVESAKRIARDTAQAAAAASAAFAAIVQSQINVADQAGKTAERLGLTTEELTRLRFAAKLTGVEQNTLEMALQRMTRRLAEAAQGGGEAAGAIEQLGLDARALSQAGPAEAFKQISEAIQDVPTQAERVRLAFKFFDSEGVKLVNTLALGRKGIEEFGDEAERLGLVVDSKAAESAAQFNDNIARLSGTATGFARQLSGRLLPTLQGLTDEFVEAGKEADGFDGSLDGVEQTLRGVTAFSIAAGSAIANVTRAIAAFVAAFEQLEVKPSDALFGGIPRIIIRNREVIARQVELLGETFDGLQGNFADALEQAEKVLNDGFARINKKTGGSNTNNSGGSGFSPIGDTSKAINQVDGLVASLEQQIATFEKGAVATAQYRATQGDLAESFDALGVEGDRLRERFIFLTGEYQSLQDASEQAAERQRQMEQMIARAAQVVEQTRTPLEQYQAQITDLNELIARGLINQETYNRAVEDAQEAFEGASKSGEQWTARMDEITRSAARNIQTSFADFLFDPFEDGLDGMLKSFTETIQRMIAEAAAAQILRGVFGGTAVGSFLGIEGRATGGPVSAGAPYLVGERGPEIVVPDSPGVVIPNHALRVGDPGGTQQAGDVIVNNYSGARVRARQENTPDASGLKRTVIDIMAEDADNNGPGSRAIARNFGLTRRPA